MLMVILLIVTIAIVAVLARLLHDWQTETLTGPALLVGGLILFVLLGVEVAGIQTLVMGPAL